MARRKSHNPTKRMQRFFSCLTLWSWESDVDPVSSLRNARATARVNGVWQDLGPSHVSMLVNTPLNWRLCCRALCRGAGEEWVELEMTEAKQVALNDLEELYRMLRTQVTEHIRQDMVADIGWIATTFLNRPDDDRWYLHGLGHWTEERQALWLKYQDRVIEGVKVA